MLTDTPTRTIGALTTLYDSAPGTELPLPPELAQFYGVLRLPLRADRPYVIANMVTSLDGVASLAMPGYGGGKEISGGNSEDRALMGLLRSVADAVVVGAGTLREGKGRPLTASKVHPPLSSAYAEARAAMGKKGSPLAVIVTASGNLDPSMEIFNAGNDGGQVLVVTTSRGADRLHRTGLTAKVCVVDTGAVDAEGRNRPPSIRAQAVLEAVSRVRPCEIILVEGGPRLLADFFAESAIDEQFLTLSPQLVGRDASARRPGLLEGQTFAPTHPLWGTLLVAKQGGNHLFLRYTFERPERSQTSNGSQTLNRQWDS